MTVTKHTYWKHALSICGDRPVGHLINGIVRERVAFNEEAFGLWSNTTQVETAHSPLPLQVMYQGGHL